MVTPPLCSINPSAKPILHCYNLETNVNPAFKPANLGWGMKQNENNKKRDWGRWVLWDGEGGVGKSNIKKKCLKYEKELVQ